MLRDHNEIVIESFGGWWARNDEACPDDHFTDCNNITYIEGGFRTRDGIDVWDQNDAFYGNVLRMYTFVQQTGESLLILNDEGNIFHNTSPTPDVPILHVDGMVDFGFVAVAGRAYLTPCNGETGLEGEYIYVYKGDGTPARRAGGDPPSILGAFPFIAFESSDDGIVDKGVHIIAVAFDSGGLGPEVFPVVLSQGKKQITLVNIPLGPSGTTSRKIVMTKAIKVEDYVPDQTTYTYYQALIIADNTTESININIADISLTSSVAIATGGPVTNALLVENTDTIGNSEPGFHLFGVVFETDTGYLTAPGPEFFAGQTMIDLTKKVKISNIPISDDSFVVARRIVATKLLENYDNNQTGYTFYFVPDGRIANNTDTEIEISFFDADLLDDASHLLDNFINIPAGVGLNTYHGRLIAWTTFNDISIMYVSAVGEPEAISQVDGLLIAPLDGNPLTNGQEFRDVLYGFKKTRTYAWNDNGDAPSSWPLTVIDQGIGASVHGIATVLDSGGVNIDYLIIIDYSGIMLFNGSYIRPELSYKIKDFWFGLLRSAFKNIQIMNDSLSQILYLTLPEKQMIIGDYSNGMDPKAIRWAKWLFDIDVTTITLIDTNKLVIGANGQAETSSAVIET
jgi:hypothetical protein